jgi:hypothetical protein
VWAASSDNSLVNNGGITPTFDNSGTFRKSRGLGTTTNFQTPNFLGQFFRG